MKSKILRFCCVSCFEDIFVKRFIEDFNLNGDCKYCSAKNVFIAPVDEVGYFIRKGINRAYEIYVPDSMISDLEDAFYMSTGVDRFSVLYHLRHHEDILSDRLVKNDGSDILSDLGGGGLVGDLIELSANIVRKNNELDLLEAGSMTRLQQKFAPKDKYSVSWDSFKHYVKHYSRFFDFENDGILRKTLLEPLSELFEKLTYNLQIGTKVWRSRIMDESIHGKSKEEINSLMGPPPFQYSGNSRMSPAGISYFYVADKKDTCIAEIRPDVGVEVWSAEFETTKELKVLDLTSIWKYKDSIMDTSFVPDRKRIPEFVKSFSNEISEPIHQNEALLDYVPTQAISEYIRGLRYDGMKFKSSLSNYKNLHFGHDKNNYVFFCGPEMNQNPMNWKLLPSFTNWFKIDACLNERITEVSYKTYMRTGAHGGGDGVSFL